MLPATGFRHGFCLHSETQKVPQMDVQLGVTISLAQPRVRVDNQPGTEGVRKQSVEVAAIQVPSGSRIEHPWVPTLEKHDHHP